MPRRFSRQRSLRARTAVVIGVSASLLAVAFVAPATSLASSSDQQTLTHRKSQLSHSIASSSADLDEISHRLLASQDRLDTAAGELATARATLRSVQAQEQAAAARDARMQRALDAALVRLHNAQADVTLGRQTVAQQRAALAANAVSTAQARISQFSTLSLLLNANSARSAISQVQTSNSAVNTQLMDLQRLQANQVLLSYTEQRVKAAEIQVAADRRAAARNLAVKQQLAADAAAAASDVAQRVSTLRDRKSSLASAKRAEVKRIDAMKREQAQVEAHLRRIAAAQARAAAAAAARRAAARQAAQAAAAAAQSSSGGSGGSSPGASSSASTTALPSDGGYLSPPVLNSYITSPYGMRMNPVVHVYELHDGTDFHADCGTPVYAAAAGTVGSEYWSDVYGNRLFINHGIVRGVSLQTSYNHLSKYVASPGQQVSRGQLIAYSGTTGWSTGCHLHFSVYVNGATVDPVTWL